ncbi:MAG: DnaA/Hda family protein [Alphaproteobacteria bacterium]|nr:DnaA/Hda family protein [Alphaproteobacteria bacterium]
MAREKLNNFYQEKLANRFFWFNFSIYKMTLVIKGREMAMMAACVDPVKSVSVDSVKSVIRSKMDPTAFDSWIAPLAGAIENNAIHFVAANQFSADFIKSTYIHIIQAAASEFGLNATISTGRAVQTIPRISVNDNIEIKNYEKPSISTVSCVASSGFDDFIASEENSFAITAAKKAAAGKITFSPLFIYGSDGCGKSLLMECVENEARKNKDGGRTLRLDGAQFVSEFQRAITERTVFAFKDFMRNCDIFILDDVQILCGKRATSEEFLALLVDLVRMGKNVILTANAAPSMLTGFDRRMQSVLASGLVVDLVAPSKTVRKNMLGRAGVRADVADALASRAESNGHIVAGLCKKISAWREMMNADVTLDVAERLLADSLQKQKTPLTMARAMAAKLGVSFEDVTSASRVRPIVRVRQIMMAALKSATNLSLSEIGRVIGGRDHATVLYGLAQIEKMKSTDLVLVAEIAQMIEECK